MPTLTEICILDKNNNFKPKFSIGPNWYMTMVLNSMIIIISFVLYILIVRKLKFIFRIAFIILSFLSLFGISRAALTHVEINMNKQEDVFHNNPRFLQRAPRTFCRWPFRVPARRGRETGPLPF